MDSELLSGNPRASPGAQLHFVFLLVRLSSIMNGSLSDSEYIGVDLFEKQNKTRNGVPFA